jgi:hypothetical protein
VCVDIASNREREREREREKEKVVFVKGPDQGLEEGQVREK